MPRKGSMIEISHMRQVLQVICVIGGIANAHHRVAYVCCPTKTVVGWICRGSQLTCSELKSCTKRHMMAGDTNRRQETSYMRTPSTHDDHAQLLQNYVYAEAQGGLQPPSLNCLQRKMNEDTLIGSSRATSVNLSISMQLAQLHRGEAEGCRRNAISW